MGIFDFLTNRNRLSDLQEILIPGSSSQGRISEKELMHLAKQTINNDMRIMAESDKIVRSTKNKETFDSRIKLMDECMSRIRAILPYFKTSVSENEVINTYENDINDLKWQFKSRINDEIRKYSIPYYETIEKIEPAWSVISNLGSYTGEEAKSFEQMCKQSIKLYQKYIAKASELDPDYIVPKNVPAYVRLAMLYEKQLSYNKAIDICVQAIRNGAYDDHSNGKMYGRLARMIKKSGIDVTDDIKKLTLIDTDNK